MKSDLSKVKVGDKIWTIQSGWTEVIQINEKTDYPIRTEEDSYTFDGKSTIFEKHPSAFLEYPFKEQPIEKDTVVWFRDGEDHSWINGYYSHFENGKHFCFANSLKSDEAKAYCSWNIVTTENPLI